MKNLPERIVYVDDEQDLRNIVRETIEAEGYEGALATCGSGKELFDRLRILQPELIMLDLKMPDMDGLEIIEKLKLTEEAAETPIVFVTGETRLEMVKNYNHLGVIGVIHKPINVDEFPAKIRQIWMDHKGISDEPEEGEGGAEPEASED